MTDEQFKQMVDEALENWDFKNAENGKGLKKSLNYMSKNPAGLAAVFTANYAPLHADKWQALDEMAYVYISL